MHLQNEISAFYCGLISWPKKEGKKRKKERSKKLEVRILLALLIGAEGVESMPNLIPKGYINHFNFIIIVI